MAAPVWNRLPLHDMQNDDPFPVGEVENGMHMQDGSEDTRPRRARSITFVAVAGVLLIAGILWTSGSDKRSAELSVQEEGIKVESDCGTWCQYHKAMRAPGDKTGQTNPWSAFKRETARHKLVLEKDLNSLFFEMMDQGSEVAEIPGSSGDSAVCRKQAGIQFDDFSQQSGIVKELQKAELKSFKDRFMVAVEHSCKDASSEGRWWEVVGIELQRQKPIITRAHVDSWNRADLGFQVKMYDWLDHETAESVKSRLGLLQADAPESFFKSGRDRKFSASALPESFQAESKWPQCNHAILRIHNQGHCGSCWAFGAMASLDARLCIATKGAFNSDVDILSRLQATSCAAEMQEGEGADGCQGGWPYWAWDRVAQAGAVSSSCLPYYIGGEGVDHFQQQDESPPCALMTHCQGGYSMSMADDVYSAPGVENYDWVAQIHGAEAGIALMKQAIYEEGPVSFTLYANGPFMGYAGGVFSACSQTGYANHAVYASGWGVLNDTPYFQSSNSWGVNWGDRGRFLLSPICVVDCAIAGTINHNARVHEPGSVDDSVPEDPTNPLWPWPAPEECPVVDGCVTDLEGEGMYGNSEKCVSDFLNGGTVHVDEFQLEDGYDVLQINGRSFSGSKEQALEDGLEGLVVDEGGISFATDGSVAGRGFRLCIK